MNISKTFHTHEKDPTTKIGPSESLPAEKNFKNITAEKPELSTLALWKAMSHEVNYMWTLCNGMSQ